MINLIKNELIKIFKRKTIYILMIITFAFVIFHNVIYKVANKLVDSYNLEYSSITEKDYEEAKEEISKLNPNNSNDVDDYILLKTEMDIYQISKNYKKGSWQEYLINTDLMNTVSLMNNVKYKNHTIKNLEKSEDYQSLLKEYNNFLSIIKGNNWQVYAKYKIKQYQEENEILKEFNDDENNSYTEQISENNKEIDSINLRLKYNIAYGNNYFNEAISNYDKNLKSFEEYNKEKKSQLGKKYNEYEVKKNYKELKEQNEKYKYALENKYDYNNMNTLGYGLVNVLSDYSTFILVITIVIAGSIVSSEFDKGTIKLLLVRPYNRWKILLSKYIASLLILIISIIFVIISEFLVGGAFFGFSSINVPNIIYNFNTNQIMYINTGKMMLLNIITSLPMFILLITLAFTISTIFTNTAVAIAIPILGYFSSEIINLLASNFKISFLKYFVTLNWNLSSYLFGGIGLYQGLTMPFSITVCIIYLMIMIIASFIIFDKKNIKNI